MTDKLKNYCDGKINLTKHLNIILRDMSRDWYSDVGRYIYDAFDGKLPLSLSMFTNEINKPDDKLGRTYSSLCIFFITGTLDDVSLRKMFGEPIYHDEFGEGFYDDDDSPPTIKHQYASYFVTINNHLIHIGYDHRGTSFEVSPNLSPLEVCDIIKSLVDIYKQKVN